MSRTLQQIAEEFTLVTANRLSRYAYKIQLFRLDRILIDLEAMIGLGQEQAYLRIMEVIGTVSAKPIRVVLCCRAFERIPPLFVLALPKHKIRLEFAYQL